MLKACININKGMAFNQGNKARLIHELAKFVKIMTCWQSKGVFTITRSPTLTIATDHFKSLRMYVL